MSEAKHTPLIAMIENLGLGHKGKIIITNQQRINANDEPIAQNIITEEFAEELLKRWNNHDALMEALREIAKTEGVFSRDRLTHAKNTIKAMKKIAEDVLAGIKE